MIPACLPKSPLGKAFQYLDNNWKYLFVYLTDGRLHIDNNPVEQSIRPFTIGRKNWLFHDSTKGAYASEVFYSLIETAKSNHVAPYFYLKALFTELPRAKTPEQLEALLPWRMTVEKPAL